MGTLTLAAPTGGAEGASARLRTALAEADVIAAADPGRLRRLAADLGVSPSARVVSYRDANGSAGEAGLLDELRAGRDVLVVADAGLPGASDPAYGLMAAAVEAEVPVTVLPGPSAVTTALVVSGLPGDRFCAEGFLPSEDAERAARLRALADEPRTMVFSETPDRLAGTLEAMAEALGADRPAAVRREPAGTPEEVRRGPLGELAAWAAGGVGGDVTVVVAGAPEGTEQVDVGDLAAEVERRVGEGTPRKQAIGDVAREHGVPKRELYDAVIAYKADH
ncbi:16S rRNA (cytidine(1402)-2'-O)-methyltransferase [Actinoallomurus rhizosphaericola]|uniref:16S rRNA (cytidine(1402)-2'-O)-methyltransferase n=1 Tax=Actinoallomurus rhizosphaericola TaxID=2952536 RepID=UPI002091B146|nr:SAM-dependent methyltransferase [Actinoallomurus rhizosphaericola]MCO5992837.1 SAM-dependent methyltransferase [Actinoallomurus rhizosphaericola]